MVLSSIKCDPPNRPSTFGGKKFEIPISIYPVKDTINIGDTIFIEGNVPDTLLEIYQKKYYTVDDIKYLNGTFSFWKLVNANLPLTQQQSNALNYDVKVYSGELAPPTATFRKFKFYRDGALRKIRFAFVPKDPGVHYIGAYSDYYNVMYFRSIPGQKESGYNILKQHTAQRIQAEDDPNNSYPLRDGAYTFIVK